MPIPRVVVAPSGFKESLSAEEVAAAIAAGVRAACPEVDVVGLPLVDGGEGFTETLVRATGGELFAVRATGPGGDPIAAKVGFLGGDGPRTGVLEMAAAAGLRLVPRERRDPLATTTYGVGELIGELLDRGAERLLVGCGDSGTNDGGAGMAQALGVRLLDAGGDQIGHGGAALSDLERIDVAERDPRLADVPIDVACNVHNLLCGPKGVARVFGPQKGATPETVDALERALERFAGVIERDLGQDVRQMPGGGASGGLGAGLAALLGATLHPRFDLVMRYLDLDGALAGADLVVTAEGGLDFQTPRGKVPAEVARRAKARGLPVVALAGTIGQEATINHDHGIDAYFGVLTAPMSLDEAIEQAAAMVTGCAENAMRLFLLGVGRGSERAREGRDA